MSDIKWISNQKDFDLYIESMHQETWVGIDTEFATSNTYYPVLCLIQIHCYSSTACIDALMIDDLSALTFILNNKNTLKIFHDFTQDIIALQQRVNFHACQITDTQIAAAFCGYHYPIGYGKLVAQICNVELPKEHTRYPWEQRPLPRSVLQYAADDVRYLHLLSNDLSSKIGYKHKWCQAEIESALSKAKAQQQNIPKIKSRSNVSGSSQRILRKFSIWRDELARKKNKPRGWILSDKTLCNIMSDRPKSIREVENIILVNEPKKTKYAKVLYDILYDVLDKVQQSGEDMSVYIKKTKIDKSVKQDIMEIIQTVADEHQINSAIIGSKKSIRHLLHIDNHDCELLSGWRAEILEESLRPVLEQIGTKFTPLKVVNK